MTWNACEIPNHTSLTHFFFVQLDFSFQQFIVLLCVCLFGTCNPLLCENKWPVCRNKRAQYHRFFGFSFEFICLSLFQSRSLNATKTFGNDISLLACFVARAACSNAKQFCRKSISFNKHSTWIGHHSEASPVLLKALRFAKIEMEWWIFKMEWWMYCAQIQHDQINELTFDV